MSYIYEKLRDALGGKQFTAGKVSKNWSPNEIRAIIIMRDFILIADYLSDAKVILLDPNEVGLDLENPSRQGFLNNLLSNRQLSCMEEIYVDSVFMNFTKVIDLESYVRGAYNSTSRLRYYGYVTGMESQKLRGYYYKARSESVFDFTLAKTIGGFKYNSTGNEEWYKRYNLRPQYYTLDSDRGRLAQYFNKCRSLIEESEKNKLAANRALEESRSIASLILFDSREYDNLKILFALKAALKNSQLSQDIAVRESLQEFLTLKTIPGLTPAKVQNAMKGYGIDFNTNKGLFENVYKKLIDNSGKSEELDLNKYLDSYEGFVQLGSRLFKAIKQVQNKLTGLDAYVSRSVISGIIDDTGDKSIADLFTGPELRKDDVGMVIDVYVRYLLGVCGFTRERFIEFRWGSK